MPRHPMRFFVLSLTCSVVAVLGCDSLPNPAETDDVKPAAAADDHSDHDHAHDDHGHSSTGPHQGLLVELGSDEYHAEVVHDDAAGTVTVYLLDAAAKAEVTSEEKEITINTMNGDQPVQFRLAGTSKEGETETGFSEYTLADRQLTKLLDDHGVKSKLSVTIKGQPFSGQIPHDDHADHSHSHP